MNLALLCLVVLTPAAPARAADPASQATPASPKTAGRNPYAQVDDALVKVRQAVESFAGCRRAEAELKSDYSKKKAQYAVEYRSKVPLELLDLQNHRMERVQKLHQACVQQYHDLGKQFDWAMQVFGGVEPKSLNISKQREKLKELDARYKTLEPKGQ